MKTVKLGDVCDFRRGLTYKKTEEVTISKNIVLRANNINLSSFALNFDELKYISDKIEIPESKYIKKNTILICTASGSKSHLGKVALVDQDYGYAFGGFMGLIVPDYSQIRASYLYKVLISKSFRDLIDSLTDGANINNLKFSLIEDFEFVLPSLEEQWRIVARLDAAFEKISAAEVLTQQNLDNVEVLRKSILHKYLSASDNTRTYRLADLLKIRHGRDWKGLASGKIPVFGSGGFMGKYVDTFAYNKPTVLLPRKGTITNIFYLDEPFWNVDTVFYTEINTNKLLPKYFYHFMQTIDLRLLDSGSGRPSLTQSALYEVEIDVPAIDIQVKVIKKIDKALDDIDQLTMRLNKRMSTVVGLRNSLLQEAFSTTNKV